MLASSAAAPRSQAVAGPAVAPAAAACAAMCLAATAAAATLWGARWVLAPPPPLRQQQQHQELQGQLRLRLQRLRQVLGIAARGWHATVQAPSVLQLKMATPVSASCSLLMWPRNRAAHGLCQRLRGCEPRMCTDRVCDWGVPSAGAGGGQKVVVSLFYAMTIRDRQLHLSCHCHVPFCAFVGGLCCTAHVEALFRLRV